MPSNVQTCPKCGALITPNLSRCRRCGTFLHGMKIEGALFEGLLPESMSKAPGTGLMAAVLLLYFVMMVMLAGPESALGLSGYAVRQLGSIYSVAIYQGDYWRFCTAMLGHGGIVHLLFNLYALVVIGPLIEELYERKKMILIFVVGGTLSMVASHIWFAEIWGRAHHVSIGASGGTCALLGACLMGARRKGSEGRDVARTMASWTAYMLLFGLVVDNIDNAAHIAGWLVGAGLAWVFPMGLNPNVTTNRIYSALMLVILVGLTTSVGFMLNNLHGYGAQLAADRFPRRILFFEYAPGKPWKYSSQYLLVQRCDEAWKEARRDPGARADAIDLCERANRAWPYAALTYVALDDLYTADGNVAAAERQRRAFPYVRR